jgi:hypothetical protein
LDGRVESGDDVKGEGAASVKFTYDDFLNFPDDGRRHEIVHGEHYVTPSPNTNTRGCRCGCLAPSPPT